MSTKKRYAKVWDRETGKVLLLHRKVAAELLGRPLLPGEVVHHINGDSLDNRPENLLVLPSQRHHAAMEYRLRMRKRGQPTLFPQLLEGVRDWSPGTLFEHIIPR